MYECPRCHQQVTSDNHMRYNSDAKLVMCE